MKKRLYFPFSSFEINRIEERIYKNEKYYHIYLSYLGKYKDKIDKTQKIPETEYTKCIMKTEILDKIEMQQEPNKFTFVISDYISKEKKKNSIKAIYEITDNDINKKIKILNHSDNNKEEIKKLCDIYFEDKKIDFSFEHTFDKPGKYSFEFIFNDLLTNTSSLFYECKTLKSLDFTKFKTNYIKDMSNMFNGCCLLQFLDLSDFKTKRVTNMKKMFNDCQQLKHLDVSTFDTINVTDMSFMFNGCLSLEYLNLANFKTKSVTTMKGMFNNCNNLAYINISNFETDQIVDMSQMFSFCSSLNSLNLSKFNTYNVEDMTYMFYKCSSLKSLNINNFYTPNLINMSSIFCDCSSLTTLNIDKFSTNKVTNMDECFKNCSSLTSLNLKNFDTTYVKSMKKMFINCNSLTTLYISKTFKIEKNIFEGLNNKIKVIICDEQESNFDDKLNSSVNTELVLKNLSIIDDDNFNNTSIINSLNTSNINKNNEKSITSSVVSHYTEKILDNNDFGKLNDL